MNKIEELSDHITTEDAKLIMTNFSYKLRREGKYQDIYNLMEWQLELIAYAYECGRSDEGAER